jgi:hypothetical protein
MEVSVDRLREISNLLLSLERHGGNKIDINADYYWDVPENLRYDRYQEPIKHTVGRLSEDLMQLEQMVDGNGPVIGYALVWYAAILRRIGENANC